MAKPSDSQARELANLSNFVIEVMMSMDVWSKEELTKLTSLDLGVLRRNATQRHGVTRWKVGIHKPSCPNDVDVIDIHPRLLSDDWLAYAAWVLHHEYIHALGYLPHDSTFKSLEDMWPSIESKTMGKGFTEMLRLERAKWLWVCPKCSKEHPRQKRGNGKYLCRICKIPLKDIPNQASQS